MAFGPTFIQPPQRIPFRDRPGEVDDPFGDRNSIEVSGMNADRHKEQQFWRDEHND